MGSVRRSLFVMGAFVLVAGCGDATSGPGASTAPTTTSAETTTTAVPDITTTTVCTFSQAMCEALGRTLTWAPEMVTQEGDGFSMLVPLSVLENATEPVGFPEVAYVVTGWFEVDVLDALFVSLAVAAPALGFPDTSELEQSLTEDAAAAGFTVFDSEIRQLPAGEALVMQFENPSEGGVSWQAAISTGAGDMWLIFWTASVGEFDASTRGLLGFELTRLEETFDLMIDSFRESL